MVAAHAALVDDGSASLELDHHWRPLLTRLRPDLSPTQASNKGRDGCAARKGAYHSRNDRNGEGMTTQ